MQSQTHLAEGMLHVGSAEKVRQPYGKPARSVVSKAADLVGFLGLDARVRGDAICDLNVYKDGRKVVRSYAGVEMDGTVEFLQTRGSIPAARANRLERLVKYGDSVDIERLGRIAALRRLNVSTAPALAKRPLGELSDKELAKLARHTETDAAELAHLVSSSAELSLVDLRELIELKEFSKLRKVTIVLGGCLFDVNSAVVHTTTGTFDMVGLAHTAGLSTRVRRIEIVDESSFYEDETPARLGRLTILFATALLRLNPELEVDLVVDVPSAEYTLYPYEGAVSGYIRPEQCTEWFPKVEERSGRVERSFQSVLDELLGNSRVSLRMPRELKSVADFLNVEMGAGRTPEFAEVLSALEASADAVMRLALTLVRPGNVRALTGLSYVMSLVRSMLRSDFVIEVDNRSEAFMAAEAERVIGLILEAHRAWRAGELDEAYPHDAQKIAGLMDEIGEELRAGALLAVYPLEKIHVQRVPRENNPLYRYQIGGAFLLPDGTEVSRKEALEQLYPRPQITS
ncbi:hypothetical protein E1281_25305 [Actinomadura sp. KC345]|nr:hypothetical protein E1281_25305 [Actinomadura sp. KC345]